MKAGSEVKRREMEIKEKNDQRKSKEKSRLIIGHNS